MNPFHRYLSFLMVLMVLGGCGQSRAPVGQPYAVTLGEGVLVASESQSASAEQRSENRSENRKSSSSWNLGGSWGGNGGGSGEGLLVVLAAVVAVIIVAGVVIYVVDSASSSDQPVERYYVTLSGAGVPLEIVTISNTNHMFLKDHQYDALIRGAYTRAVIRPAIWEGSHGAPIQEVHVTALHGSIAISLAHKTPAEVLPSAPLQP